MEKNGDFQSVIYLDNAATSFPKPREVTEAICDFMENIGANPGRGGHSSSLDAGRIILATREELADLFKVSNSSQVILTQNITHSLNLIIKGFLKAGDHVITTSFEHNSVLRPLHRLKEEGMIDFDYLPISLKGKFAPEDLEKLTKPSTTLVVVNHASNVTGTKLPVAEIARTAKKLDLAVAIDTAQTAGCYNYNWQLLQDIGVDFIAFTGHKGLFGPQGTGGLIISQEAAAKTSPFIEGGTGSKSDLLLQPDLLPDKFEAGTQNTPGIAGLLAGLKFIKKTGRENIAASIKKRTKQLYQGFQDIAGVEIIGPDLDSPRVSTISVTFGELDPAEIAFQLDKNHGIMTRSGLHCASLAHKVAGTYPGGTLRFSPGFFTTEKEIDQTLKAVAEEINRLKN